MRYASEGNPRIKPKSVTMIMAAGSLSHPEQGYTTVRDFNLLIPPGEFVCLPRHSGCGKSTVLSILAGLQRATLGGFCIDGKEIDYPGTDRGVGSQSPSLLPWLTAAENVGLAYKQAHSKGDKQAVLEYIKLAEVADVADQLPGELSLGTQQRVAIARELALDPRYLLLDEPFECWTR